MDRQVTFYPAFWLWVPQFDLGIALIFKVLEEEYSYLPIISA